MSRRYSAPLSIAVLLLSVLALRPVSSQERPPQTLPVQTEWLREYKPYDAEARLNGFSPYDQPPYPAPYEGLSFNAISDMALREVWMIRGRVRDTLPAADRETLIDAGIVGPDVPQKGELVYLRLRNNRPDETDWDFLIKIDELGVRIDFPLAPAAWNDGGIVHVGKGGEILWFVSGFSMVRRLVRMDAGYFIYELNDNGQWELMHFHNGGSNPYRPVLDDEKIPRKQFRPRPSE